MKTIIGFLVLGAGVLFAQSDVERTSVPLSDPSRPAHIHATQMTGGITVKGYAGKEVTVEAHVRTEGRQRERTERSDGLHRVELPGVAGLEVTEEGNDVHIHTSSMRRPVDLVIMVPTRSSVEVKCMNDGDIVVEHVEGEVDANNLNGRVTLRNISGSVLAHSLNGEVLVTMDRVDGAKPMSFSTLNGNIDVTLPGSTKANVKLKTDNGDILTDFELKMQAGSHLETEPKRESDGTYHVRYDRTLRGSINGGGPEFQFTSFNGQIIIRKQK